MHDQILKTITPIIPMEIRGELTRLYSENLEELRLRAGRSPGVVIRGTEKTLNAPVTTKAQLEQMIGAASGHSSFAALSSGFLTLSGGHRIGFCGNAVVKDGKIQSLHTLSSINIRIAREMIGAAEPVIQKMGGRMESVLFVGPPGSGKTTILRDMIRLCSDVLMQRVGVADERGELAAVKDGVPGFNVGKYTDVLTGGPRGEALEQLLRVMNPTVLAMDEIVSEEEIDALRHAGRCGVKLLATIHASSFSEIKHKRGMDELQELFPWLVLVDRHKIRMERWE